MSRQVSIIIVNYNTGSLLYNCLESIRTHVSSDYEVIVVDNASTDGSMDRCASFADDSRFIFLPQSENYGFAKANNIGAAHSIGRMLHFLNPDTEVSAGMDDDYRQALAFPEKVYVNPLQNPDGSVENRPMPLPLIRDMFFWYARRSRARVWYRGASVIISRDNFLRAGRWSEDYFMYAEDLDFFYSLWLRNIEVCLTGSVIFHLGGGSSSRRWTSLEREVVVQRSTRKFYRKYFSNFQYVTIKIYFIFHYLLKNPRRVPQDIRAWMLSSKR